MSTQKNYQELTEKLREISDLEGIKSILGWDQRVNLPPEGSEPRSRQNAAISDIIHQKKKDPELGKLLDRLERDRDQLSFDQQVVLREARREFEQASSLPDEFVQEKAKATSEAYEVWVNAREENDFASFLPCLKKNVELARQEAEHLGYESSPYNALIDKYDPGLTEDRVETLFNELREHLVPLVERHEKNDQVDETKETILAGEWPESKQEEIGVKIIKAFGYNTDAGRLDTTVHPFCSGYKGDVRITTRYNDSNPFDSWTSIMHECGHALYEQGLDDEHWGTPLSEPVGMAVHESQSRLWENMVGRSEEFWSWIWPEVQEIFPEQTEQLDRRDVVAYLRSVEPGYIRVEADEVTYNLHVILRFEIERKLIKGDLNPEDVPDEWNRLMEELLGLTPPDHRKGALQDMHWSGGAFGYFPSYAIGNLIAAQLFETIYDELQEPNKGFLTGDFSPLLSWLRENVHQLGKRYRTEEIVEEVTDQSLSVEPFLNHIRASYIPDIAGGSV